MSLQPNPPAKLVLAFPRSILLKGRSHPPFDSPKCPCEAGSERRWGAPWRAVCPGGLRVSIREHQKNRTVPGEWHRPCRFRRSSLSHSRRAMTGREHADTRASPRQERGPSKLPSHVLASRRPTPQPIGGIARGRTPEGQASKESPGRPGGDHWGAELALLTGFQPSSRWTSAVRQGKEVGDPAGFEPCLSMDPRGSAVRRSQPMDGVSTLRRGAVDRVSALRAVHRSRRMDLRCSIRKKQSAPKPANGRGWRVELASGQIWHAELGPHRASPRKGWRVELGSHRASPRKSRRVREKTGEGS